MMLTDLADVLRAAGLKVQEIAGWTTRGHGQMTDVEAIIGRVPDVLIPSDRLISVG